MNFFLFNKILDLAVILAFLSSPYLTAPLEGEEKEEKKFSAAVLTLYKEFRLVGPKVYKKEYIQKDS